MTYICPFCKKKMIHQPNNERETNDDTLIAKVGDTFKCDCSIRSKDSDGSVTNLNSWKLEKKGWYHFGSTDGKIIVENFRIHPDSDWVRICSKTREPFDATIEVVEFT